MMAKVQIWIALSCVVLMSFIIFPSVLADNSTASVQPASGQDYNSGALTLSQGWNFIGVPRRLAADMNKASLFSNINSAGRSIWTYDPKNAGWKDLKRDDPILPLEGYWVYSAKKDTVKLTYSSDPLVVPPIKEMDQGWNAMGFSGSEPASARDSLLSIKKSWSQVIGWNDATQQFDQTIINGGSGEYADSRMLQPMKAYWVYVNESCSLASIGA